MIWISFLCLAIGIFIGVRNFTLSIYKKIDIINNIALVVLVITIGIKVGINDSVMLNLDSIGLNCFLISLCAIAFSILFTVIVEKTLLPLEELREKILLKDIQKNSEIDILQEKEKRKSPLVWVMPLSIVIGVIFGYFVIPYKLSFILDYLLMGSLVILYLSVGISFGSNSKVFKYIKIIGFRVIYLSVAIFSGSLVSGLTVGVLLDIPLYIPTMSASGMSYYSLTGAYMTQVYGIEAGTYGFIVNVMREFFTVLLLPVLLKISTGSPIAGGAAGNMDIMFVPVTRFVGIELGLVTLITGLILTVTVPVILPVLYGLF
ncbi:MAG: lysine exporter LysO family protein [Firmicutes bacterium]|nr:lysine exporter LysO family protein [Bacillota bacterium]